MKACVVGVGNMGRHHARIYSRYPDVYLTGVCDRDFTTGIIISEKYGTKYYSDFRKMMDIEKPDIVSLATPTTTHKFIGSEIIDRGVHLLIEKPIADTTENAEYLIDLASSKNVVLLVGHIERYNQGISALMKLIKNDFFGEISSLQFQRVGMAPPQIRDTNVIIDLAIHDIDLSNYLLGCEPLNVIGHLNNTHLTNRFDSCEILMSYNGTSSFIQSNWITPVKIRMVSITGKKGYAKLNLISQQIDLFESIVEREYDSFGDFVIKFKTPNISRVKVTREEPLFLEINNFIKTVYGDEELIISPQEALTALSIANKISSGDNNWVIF